MFFSKFLAIFLILVVLRDADAVRGALFRSGRAVPFERVPGQQKTAPQCREVDIFVPCLFTANRDCLIDKICVHESPVQNSKNDFLRFGRAADVKTSVGEPEFVYQ